MKVFLILPWILLALPSGAAGAPFTVVIDAGHGGVDRGTTLNGIEESNITLQVAKLLQQRLQKDGRFRPILTRGDTSGVSLANRARIVKANNAQLFLSIHVNSSPDHRARGAEFYFQNQLESDEESMFLAHKENGGESDLDRETPTYDFLEKHSFSSDISAIVLDLLNSDRVWRSSRLAKSLKQEWRGNRKSRANSVRQAPFFVLSQLTVPSSLVELGFLTNPDDFKALTHSQSLENMAEDLYRGLKAYKDSLDKNQSAF